MLLFKTGLEEVLGHRVRGRQTVLGIGSRSRGRPHDVSPTRRPELGDDGESSTGAEREPGHPAPGHPAGTRLHHTAESDQAGLQSQTKLR